MAAQKKFIEKEENHFFKYEELKNKIERYGCDADSVYRLVKILININDCPDLSRAETETLLYILEEKTEELKKNLGEMEFLF